MGKIINDGISIYCPYDVMGRQFYIEVELVAYPGKSNFARIMFFLKIRRESEGKKIL